MSPVAQAPPREQTRACYPDEEGYVEREGVRVFWERYGDGEHTVTFLPTWTIVHSRVWKMQIPVLARRFRVVKFDPRGNGKSDRPETGYAVEDYTRDALAVLDAAGVQRTVVVGFSDGTYPAITLAALAPELVEGVVLIGSEAESENPEEFWHRRDGSEEWDKFNAVYWLEHYEEFLSWFFAQVSSEPHSTKQIEDCVGWGLETTPEVLVANEREFERLVTPLLPRVRCPVLAIHGLEDTVVEPEHGISLAQELKAPIVLLEGSGHCPQARDPVKVNGLLREFLQSSPSQDPKVRTWTRAASRRRRALYVSSPIGLGHARRDVAIAKELRKLVPDLEIDWLAQHPVTAVLEAEGERIHPASAELANESGHIESESAEHDLHVFQAWRRMDEILVANFMLFHDVVRDDPYDLWIGDEAWEVDYYLHENPELKSAAYVWLTDFVGWLPMTDGGEREAFLTADYNAEMIEHIARFPRVRDQAIFVGNPEDVVSEPFGPELPRIRDWTEQHYDFAGYVTGFEPVEDRERLRAELGYSPGEQVCIVTVGGSGVGGQLLRRVIDAYPPAKELVPELRMIVVAGPRIDPATLPEEDGLEVRSYVHDLYRHLAACDLAVVQGGLTTAMELTANGRPFLYFPLRHHFEQNLHVRHRLERYGAGRRMDFDEATPDVIALAIAEEIGREVDYLPVETDGAARAAARIAELL
jgi:pimeloyl-ACP methyl ester carboxylesterase/predicted glycosyltransferase